MSGSDKRVASTKEVEVSLLFTDIEGSTAKWEADPGAMRMELARHDKVLTETIIECGGAVVKHTGDGFLARFETCAMATSAAFGAQVRLAALDFSAVGGLSIRAAVDDGLVEDRNGDLYGLALNRCARAMDAAHGGQVLVSESVRGVLQTGVVLRLDGDRVDVGFADLGLHRLKGLAHPQHLYQMLHPQLREHFPPLRSLNASVGNLPVATTTVLGRAELLDQIRTSLETPGVVTLVGPGGVGKTILAIRAGHDATARFPDGVWLVDLASVSSPRGLEVALARDIGVAQRTDQTLDATLRDVLSSRQMLLILDNAEHLTKAVHDLLARVLVHGSPSRLLVTSRMPLGGATESMIRVGSLQTPKESHVTSVESALECPAIALFVQRACSARPTFALSMDNLADVTAICDRLDGLPLAIELAASRSELMSLGQIRVKLDDRFRLLQAGVAHESRHRTLLAVLDWSYENLSDEAKRLFERLSTLASSFDIEVATALSGTDEFNVIDQLGELARNSIVATEFVSGEPRYRLTETLRDYGWLRLVEYGNVAEVRRLHHDFFSGIATDLRRAMWSEDALSALDRCRLELSNLSRAFKFSLEMDPLSAIVMVTDLYALWLIRDLFADGLDWLEEAFEAIGGISNAPPSPELMAGLDDAGTLAWLMGKSADAQRYLEAAIAVADRLGVPPPPKALVRLGSIRSLAGDSAEGRRLCQLARSIALEHSNDVESVMVVERTLGAVLAFSGEAEEGAAICEQAITRARSTDLWLASALTNLSLATFEIQPVRAAEASLEAIDEGIRIGSKYYHGGALVGLGLAQWILGDEANSCRAYAEALTLMLDSGARQNVLMSLNKLSEALEHTASDVAVVLAAGVAALMPGPGSDGTWQEARRQMLRARVGDHVDNTMFEDAWSRGKRMSIDDMVVLARETVDEVWPELVGGVPVA